MYLRAAFTAGLAALVLAGPARAETYTVTNGSSDAAGTCAGTTCSTLRAALAAAALTRPDDTINVAAGTITLASELAIATDVTINGQSARENTIDGGNAFRGLRVASGVTATLAHYTIRRGAAGTGDGGGILNNGALTLESVHITGSRAARGGGVANTYSGTAGASLTIAHSLIDGNEATGAGGGVANIGAVETSPLVLLALSDSTVFANTGGGIAAVNAGGLTLALRSTIADNKGTGLLTTVSARTQVMGSIVARNTTNCSLKPTNNGFNVEDNDTCGFGAVANPVLATKLSDAGGEVDVLEIGAGSAALDKIAVGDNCEAGSLDQRGLRRPQGSACDAGAVELDVPATYTITGGPTGTITTDSAQLDFSSTDPSATPECQLTGPGQPGGYGPCYKSNAALYTKLANGSFTFSVRDSDFPASTPATRSFTVAALDSTITDGPPNPTNDTTPTFTFTGANGATSFQCRVDTATFATCASPFTTATLTPGPHSFEVRALNGNGVPENTPSARTFTIDTTAPDTTITSGPTGDVASTSATFTFSSEAGATFECSLDNPTTFGPCPLSYTGLSQGSHTFRVRAKDAAGNVDASPATRTFTVDTVPPPLPEVTSGPDGPTSERSPAFAFSAADAARVECRLDGPGGAVGTFGGCVSPAVFDGLAPGDYVFLVRATDAAGNAQVTQRAFTVTVPQQATPTPTPTPTASPSPTPVANQSVGALPLRGVVLVKVGGKFVPLAPSLIKNGTEIDARKGVVQITTATGEVARFYDGRFKITQARGLTTLTLTEKLSCAKRSLLAAKKPKTRKLWGDGKGKFRTRGSYSAATVRGTKWLVQDTCTTTVTRVARGVVQVEDFAKRKKVLVKAPKRYTARAKRKGR
jgi:hypothetical protein